MYWTVGVTNYTKFKKINKKSIIPCLPIYFFSSKNLC